MCGRSSVQPRLCGMRLSMGAMRAKGMRSGAFILVPPLLRRHGNPLIPRAAAPAAACVCGRSSVQPRLCGMRLSMGATRARGMRSGSFILVPPLLRRHGNPLIPRAAAPAAACVCGRSSVQPRLCGARLRMGATRARGMRSGSFILVPPLLRRHGNPLIPRAAAPAAACVCGRSSVQKRFGNSKPRRLANARNAGGTAAFPPRRPPPAPMRRLIFPAGKCPTAAWGNYSRIGGGRHRRNFSAFV